jgi:hypothetical protein
MRRGLDGRRRWRIWSGTARVVSVWEYDGGLAGAGRRGMLPDHIVVQVGDGEDSGD